MAAHHNQLRHCYTTFTQQGGSEGVWEHVLVESILKAAAPGLRKQGLEPG